MSGKHHSEQIKREVYNLWQARGLDYPTLLGTMDCPIQQYGGLSGKYSASTLKTNTTNKLKKPCLPAGFLLWRRKADI